MATKTINISISENDLRKIDDYCTCHNLTRSKFLLSSAIEKIHNEEISNSLLLLNQYVRVIAKKNVLDENDVLVVEKILDLIRNIKSNINL